MLSAASCSGNVGCVGDWRAVDDVESSRAAGVAASASFSASGVSRGSALRVGGDGAVVVVGGRAEDVLVDEVGASPSASSACAVSSGEQGADIGRGPAASSAGAAAVEAACAGEAAQAVRAQVVSIQAK